MINVAIERDRKTTTRSVPGLRAALLPLSSSAACCTPYRDEVAKLFWTRRIACGCSPRCSRAARVSRTLRVVVSGSFVDVTLLHGLR
jgi:hypothetical protein